MDDTRALKVSTTADTVELAGRLAQSALAANLAGGAEVIGPVDAYSWHKGAAVRQPEWRVTLTHKDCSIAAYGRSSPMCSSSIGTGSV